MKAQTLLASATSLLATFSLLPLASANCAMPVSYVAKINANTVTVQPTNFGERGCPDSAGMLRENVTTGEFVKLADYCSGVTKPGSASESASSASYVDECVPAGKYRYGFAKAYTCHSSSCSTDYFTEAVVQSALASGCKRSAGNAAPVVAYTAPWPVSGGKTICEYRANPPATGGAPSTKVAGAGAPGVAGSNGISSGGSGAVAGSNGTLTGGNGAIAGSNGISSGGSGAVTTSNSTLTGGSGAVATSNGSPSGGGSAVATSSGTPSGGSGTIATSKVTPTGGSGTIASTKSTRTGASGATADNGPSTTESSQGESGNDSDSGCSMTTPPGTTAVVAVNLVTILAGLLLSRRRRRQNGK